MAAARASRRYADDILEAIANIEADTKAQDFERFAGDRRVRQLVEWNSEIISEASRRLPDEMKAAAPGVPWREIAGTGNVQRHGYGNVRTGPSNSSASGRAGSRATSLAGDRHTRRRMIRA